MKYVTLATSLSTLDSLEMAGDGDSVRPGDADSDLPRPACEHTTYQVDVQLYVIGQIKNVIFSQLYYYRDLLGKIEGLGKDFYFYDFSLIN